LDDSGIFFSFEPLDIQRAIGHCMKCPVQDECREWGVVNSHEEGVIGGMTKSERRREARRRRSAKIARRESWG
jgi:hypothetical protein